MSDPLESSLPKVSPGPRKSIHFDHVAWTPPPSLTPRKSSFLANPGAAAAAAASGGGSPMAQAAAAAAGFGASPRGRSASGAAAHAANSASPLSGAMVSPLPFEDMLLHQFRPWLFLGDAEAAGSLHALQSNKITHILNVADDVANVYPDQFVYENLKVKDFGQDSGISRVFQTAVEFAEKVQKSEGKQRLLVHCFAGMNRSPTIVIALFMTLENKSLREAFVEVKKKSPSTGLFEDSRKELVKFELEKFGKNSMTVEDFSLDLSHLTHPTHAPAATETKTD